MNQINSILLGVGIGIVICCFLSVTNNNYGGDSKSERFEELPYSFLDELKKIPHQILESESKESPLDTMFIPSVVL